MSEQSNEARNEFWFDIQAPPASEWALLTGFFHPFLFFSFDLVSQSQWKPGAPEIANNDENMARNEQTMPWPYGFQVVS